MQKAAYAYLATQVTTTDQGDLLLMLYEGAIKFLKQAKAKMEERDFAQKGMLISKALDVIAELDSSLNVEKGGELAQNLHNLYFYCNTRLLQANLRMNTAQIDEVVRILEALQEAFNQISKSKFQTKAAAVHAPEAQGQPDSGPAGGTKPKVFSIGKGGGPAPAAHVLAATAQAPATPPAYPPAAKPASATPPAYPPTARPTPVPAGPGAYAPPQPAATRPAPVAALRKPASASAPQPPAPAAAAPAPPAPPQPAPQDGPQPEAQTPPAPQPDAEASANPELTRVKALHRAYGRYGAS